MKLLKILVATTALAWASSASSTLFTSTSGSGTDVTTLGASTIGGIVLDLEGANGTHVVSQLAASTLFEGFAPGNPETIGTQTGFDSSVTDLLGGGLLSASIRFTLYDGDTGPGDFDDSFNDLFLNGFNFGDWSDVNTQHTDAAGNLDSAGSSTGFRDETLDTGWFFSNDATLLASFFNSLVIDEQVVFALNDRNNPGDNYLDFTRGIDASILNVGQGPVVVGPKPVPEPMTLLLFGLGLAGIGASKRKTR